MKKPKTWAKMPSRSRTKCREIVLEFRKKKVYLARCPKRATWQYGKISYAVRCDQHKEFNEKVVKYAVEAVEKVFKR